MFFGPATYGHTHEYGYSFSGDGEDVSTWSDDHATVWSMSWHATNVCSRSWKSQYSASRT